MYFSKMLLIRPFIRNCSSTKQINTKIFKEITQNVNPFSKIQISSTMSLIVKPYDLFDCPDANILRVSFIGDPSYLKNADDISVSSIFSNFNIQNNKNDDVIITNIINNQEINKNFQCILEVPVKSELDINVENNIKIHDMHGDKINVVTKNYGDIITKNLRSILINLHSINGGNINCKGLLLAQKIFIKTQQNGNIHLDKLQGDYLECETKNGAINTNSCYVDHSKFITKNGNLILNNVHKNSEIFLLEKGSLTMVGIHGNINIVGNETNMNLHFDELIGNNSIILNDNEIMKIYISDLIEKSCNIEIYAKNIHLDKSIEHLNNYLKNQQNFHNKIENNNNNKLLITTKGSLLLGKKSWADNIKMSLLNNKSFK